jgi:hypothetical protein
VAATAPISENKNGFLKRGAVFIGLKPHLSE